MTPYIDKKYLSKFGLSRRKISDIKDTEKVPTPIAVAREVHSVTGSEPDPDATVPFWIQSKLFDDMHNIIAVLSDKNSKVFLANSDRDSGRSIPMTGSNGRQVQLTEFTNNFQGDMQPKDLRTALRRKGHNTDRLDLWIIGRDADNELARVTLDYGFKIQKFQKFQTKQ